MIRRGVLCIFTKKIDWEIAGKQFALADVKKVLSVCNCMQLPTLRKIVRLPHFEIKVCSVYSPHHLVRP